jgi:hypothetical protein
VGGGVTQMSEIRLAKGWLTWLCTGCEVLQMVSACGTGLDGGFLGTPRRGFVSAARVLAE